MASSSRKPYGITLPLQRGPAGYFDQSFDVITQMKTDLICLLSTVPGERRMNPKFGSRLFSVIFEFNNEALGPIVGKIIREDVSTYLPLLNIKSVNVDTSIAQQDIYSVAIHIVFTVNSIVDLGDQSVSLAFTQPIV